VTGEAASSFSDPRTLLARAPVVGDSCPSDNLPTTSVSVLAAPDIAPVIEEIVTPLRRQELPDGNCLQVLITPQDPAETVAGAQILPLDRAPNLWVPDSQLWLGRLEQWKPQRVAQFASSPVVVATSTKVVSDAGWDKEPPTWSAALAGNRPVAAPNIAQDAASLSAELALWQVLGKGEKAQTALAGAVLAGLRAGAPTRESAVASAQSDAATAPLIPLTEQAVSAANKSARDPKLVAVYPGGLPSLDYPVARVDASPLTPEKRTAIQAVADALASPSNRAVVRNAGFRDTGGSTLAAAGIVPAAVTPMTPPSAEEIKGVITQIVTLSAPSRMQIVIDMSGSMRAPVAGTGKNRSQIAAAALSGTGRVLPDVAQVGLWGFARDLRGKDDRIVFQKMDELGTRNGRGSHRDAIDRDMAAMNAQLGGNGTTLYATAVAAMKEMKGLYDPRAGNAVVLVTDGANSDAGGPTLEETVAEIKELYDPERPVRLICIGIGDGIDLKAMKQLSGAAGGQAFPLSDPRALSEILFKVMTGRDADAG
jgi:Ca-activated chloride channel family protein